MITVRVEYAVDVHRPDSTIAEPWTFEHGDDLDGALARIAEFAGSRYEARLLRRTVTSTEWSPTDPTRIPRPTEGDPMEITEETTLAQAREWLEEQARKDGAHCPCCGQLAKVYKRKLNEGMARSLVKMWRAAGQDWQYIPDTVGGKSREEGKLRYWGLIQEKPGKRPDSGRTGWWRVTDLGSQFVRRVATVQRYALVYDGQCLGLVGANVNIIDALGDPFTYDELMGTQADTVQAGS